MVTASESSTPQSYPECGLNQQNPVSTAEVTLYEENDILTVYERSTRRSDNFTQHIYMKAMHMIAFILSMVGALNWGLVGIGGFLGMNLNVVNLILGSMPSVEWIVYVLVGVSAVYIVLTHKSDCKVCASGPAQM